MKIPTRVRVLEAIDTICQTNDSFRSFWTNAHGWAPKDSADILSKSRLDRQVALSHSLLLWVTKRQGPDHDARLILAWTNLGALLEGSLKMFLCVYLANYQRSVKPICQYGKVIDPDTATIGGLLTFFKAEIWPPPVNKWDSWSTRVQQRRNAIHAYKDREIGTFSEFHSDLITYAEFVVDMNLVLPYPNQETY